MTRIGAIGTMAELRQEIDQLDRDLVGLLARRAALIDRAVELKQRERLPARIGARVEAVVANVRATAAEAALDPDLAERLWRDLIDWSIAREEARLGPAHPVEGAA